MADQPKHVTYADAGVDVLYFVDPVLDRISLEKAKELFGDRMTRARP